MRIFNSIEEVIKFVVKSDDINFGNSYNIIREKINKEGDGVYSFICGSRNECEFKKVNLVDELVEWNELRMYDEFCYLCGNWNEDELDRDSDLLELGFGEEDWRYYFTIVKKKS